MTQTNPEQLILTWLDELPQRYRDTLVHQYIFMTCIDSDDLALTGDEAWAYFRSKLTVPDFPLRRAARVLTARSLLLFLLDSLSIEAKKDSGDNSEEKSIQSLDSFQYLRAEQAFRALADSELSDRAIQKWMIALDK